MSDQPNLIFSYGAARDHALSKEGHRFLGVALDARDNEVHVFLRKGDHFAPCDQSSPDTPPLTALPGGT